MQITIPTVEALRPCTDRFNNFKDNNPGFNGSLKDFLNLDNITYSDKIWVCTRLMTRNQKFRFALACAVSVQDIYNSKYPNDKRVSSIIEFMKSIPDVDKMSEKTRNTLIELRKETRNAASAYAAAVAYASAYAADAAAYSAYSAAAYAAYSSSYSAAAADAADAAVAAAYAYADAAVAYASAYAADAAARQAAREHQQNLNLILLAEVMGTEEE